MKLGKLHLKNNLVLAPLEGVSNQAFRKLCFDAGASLTYVEMTHANSIARKNKSTLDMIDTFDPDVLQGIQFTAIKPNDVAEALKTIKKLSETTHPHFKNISDMQFNLGCPSPQIIGYGGGPALMKRRKRMTEIFEALRSNAETAGVKMRLGLHAGEKQYKLYITAAQLAEQAGLDYVVVHARTAEQKSGDPITIEAIREVKDAVSIPVIGNGSVFTGKDAENMFKVTNCDGIMLARASIGDPAVFARILQHMNGEKVTEPTKAYFDDVKQKYLAYCDVWPTKRKYIEYQLKKIEQKKEHTAKD